MHLNNRSNRFEELSSYGDKISEIFKCLQLLRYLPEQFELIVQTILRWPEMNFTYDKILTELIAEESPLLLRERDWNDGIVFESKYVWRGWCGFEWMW